MFTVNFDPNECLLMLNKVLIPLKSYISICICNILQFLSSSVITLCIIIFACLFINLKSTQNVLSIAEREALSEKCHFYFNTEFDI